jgi:hypothetical protein
MRISRFFPVVLLFFLIPTYFVTLSTVSRINKILPTGDETNILLPSPILKVTSLDFDGLVSDVIYLKALVDYGSTFVGNKRLAISKAQYTRLYNMLMTSTDLDPYFLDPYFLGNSILSWEANRVADSILLLKKGSQFRNWDYWLPFYIGFNYYYFLRDNINASKYLMIASQKPGADPFFAYFAARLAYEGNRTENAIVFLEGILKTTKDETMRKDYKIRLETLKSMLDLEKGAAVYKERVGVYPAKISDLIEQRIIGRIPEDPYGGEFYIDKDGSVKTTSDLRPMEKVQGE